MRNYKALKSASKVSVRKQKIVVWAAEGDRAEESHDELQVVKKCFNPDTGAATDDYICSYSLSEIKGEIDQCKAEVVKIQASQGEWEQLETDLKAL
jgi:hypothetical protein